MLSVNDSVELLLLATAESPSSAVLSRDYSKESDLSTPDQPNLTEHKIDRPAVAPSAGPGGYRRLWPGPGPGPRKWKSATPLFCFGIFQAKTETVETGEGERERKKKGNRENLSICGVPRPNGRVSYPPAPPSPSMSLLFNISRCSIDRGNRRRCGHAVNVPTCQRAESRAAHASSLHIPGADAQ